jgi:hypothetical protein
VTIADDAEDVVCFRCGKPAEAGVVVTSGPRVVWSTRRGRFWRRARDVDGLAVNWLRAAELNGYRCERCRVCWFEY